MIRRPAVAGQFYPADPERLRSELIASTQDGAPSPRPRALAILVPHAGYIYSGAIAGTTYASVRLAPRAIVLGPNHTGRGEAIAVDDSSGWQTPLGQVPVDALLSAAILEDCAAASSDSAAHEHEHSLEVQLPFLQHLLGSVTIVPICVGTMHLPTLLDLGRAVASAIGRDRGDVTLVLSSDMSHYVTAGVAGTQDRAALERVLALDPSGLHRVVLEQDISMCGVAPVVAGLEAARRMGATTARLVAYGHSGQVTGDDRSVVAYAGVAIP